MILFIALLGIIAVICTRKTNISFLNHHCTTTINGIFVLLIFFSHSTQYFMLSNNIFDSLYLHFQNFHNQWVVTTFLAFSGYGVMIRIKNNGVEYLGKYPRNRLFKTLMNFDIAVILFLIANLLLGIHYNRWEIAGSFIGITGIGNSNWYIFTILVMYLISYLAGVGFKNNYQAIAATVTGCGAAYVVIAQLTGLPSRFVSTVVTYALGMWIAIYKDELEKIFQKKSIISLVIILLPIIFTYKLRENDYIMNVSSCFFVLLVVWFMAHFEVQSKSLYFLGKHAFSIYILQRLPMIIISQYITPTGMMNYVFVMVCLAVTICIAILFDKVLSVIDRTIIKT